MILCKEVPIPIAGLALALWTFIQVADAYDSCDVRHRFMPETRKCFLFRISILQYPMFNNSSQNMLEIKNEAFYYLQNVEISLVTRSAIVMLL